MFKKLFGGLMDSNEKEIKRVQPIIDKINALEPEFERLSDAELRARPSEFKARIAEATQGPRDEVIKTQRNWKPNANAKLMQLTLIRLKKFPASVKTWRKNWRSGKKNSKRLKSRPWMKFFRKLLPRSEKLPDEPLTSAILMCS